LVFKIPKGLEFLKGYRAVSLKIFKIVDAINKPYFALATQGASKGA
jgi:hypothetical protein